MSHLRRYILDSPHVIQVDGMQVGDNLIVVASPMQIEGREVKKLCGKEISLVKIAWGESAGGNMTWELESQMRESYSNMFT